MDSNEHFFLPSFRRRMKSSRNEDLPPLRSFAAPLPSSAHATLPSGRVELTIDKSSAQRRGSLVLMACAFLTTVWSIMLLKTLLVADNVRERHGHVALVRRLTSFWKSYPRSSEQPGNTCITEPENASRFRYPNRLTDLQERFGRDYTQLSRILNEVMDWMWETHRHRLVDYLHFYEPHFTEMAAKIGGKGGIACSDGANIIGFLDGTLRRNCRPGGPREVQQELFDGHHRAHGLAYQSVVFPNGMIRDLYGPAVGRRHDAFLLEESKLNDRLARVQENNDTQYKVYGDAAYPITSHVDRGFRGANLSDAQKAYNMELSPVRVSVEWMFGKVAAEYAFVDFKKNLKIRRQPIAKCYFVVALLTNAHTCLYGSITGFCFRMAAPSLEAYFA